MSPRAAAGEMRLAAVVPYYGGHAFVRDLLATLRGGTLVPRHIFLIDNGPPSRRLATRPPLDCVSEAQARVLQAPPAIGFGRACNLGALLAAKEGATHILLVNQDARFRPNTLERLAAGLREYEATLAGAVQVQPGSDKTSSFFAGTYFEGALATDGSLLREEEWPPSPFFLDALSGACLLFPVTVLGTTGLFDPLFTMYREDDDLSARVRAAGGRCLLIPGAVIEHHHSNARATGRARARIDAWKSEADTVKSLRDDRSPLVGAALRQIARRTHDEFWDLWHNRSGYRLLCTLRRDVSLLRKVPCILRARRGESVRRRALRYARGDLRRSTWIM